MSRRGFDVDILSHENRGVEPFYKLDGAVNHRNLFKRPIEHKAKERWKKREKFRESLPLVFPLNHLRWRMTHAGFVSALKKYIKRAKPDILIPFLPAAITPTILAARGTAAKVIASTHNQPTQDYENPERWDPNPLDVRLRKRVLSELDKILVLLPEYKNWYPAALHPRIDDMPNPIRHVDPALLEGTEREKLVLGVGRLAGVKRFDVLIEAWLDLHHDFPDWKVEIYGEGPDKKFLGSLIRAYGLEETVFLKGTTSEIAKHYLRASLLCHPAEYEGFPLAVCEALAHGLPVVGFGDCSGLNSLVKDNVNGVLVPPLKSRPNAMRESLGALLSDADRRNSLSLKAPNTVAQYSPDIVYDKWEATIRSVAVTQKTKLRRNVLSRP